MTSPGSHSTLGQEVLVHTAAQCSIQVKGYMPSIILPPLVDFFACRYGYQAEPIARWIADRSGIQVRL